MAAYMASWLNHNVYAEPLTRTFMGMLLFCVLANFPSRIGESLKKHLKHIFNETSDKTIYKH